MATPRARDWTELQNDLLVLITERLSAVDYIRFGTVCITWNSVVAGGQFYRPMNHQSPWLILCGKDSMDDEDDEDTCTFFSINDNKSYRAVSPPKLRSKWFVGSTEGWIVTVDEAFEIRLLNPLTREELRLPSITTFPGIEVTRNSEGGVVRILPHLLLPHKPPHSFPLTKFRQHYFYKVILSSYPATSDYTAMAIFSNLNKLAFAKVGDDNWTVLDDVLEDIEDVIYHNGKFYSISSKSELRAWDVSGLSPKMATISEEVENNDDCEFKKYLVESAGELLQVSRQIYERHDVNTITEVKVFKFDPIGGKWIPVSNLGDRCLFLGLNHSMFFLPRDIPGLMHNCIYFADYGTLPCVLGVFNLEDRSFKPYRPFDLLVYTPTPVWFVPNPLKIQ